ncbi:MAG TPA: geranylgeranyl reductase family protein, partial [Trebonia sp.]|nr:geranylgeranyl reductase family protein [Trebonia sp.]
MTAHRDDDADVIVVGAGPSGSTTAYYLAQAGLNVLLIEKSRFPRDKVCGDGLTPRAVKSLVAMGVDVSEEAGWLRNKGLRVIGGGLRLELDWPELSSWPGYGLVRPRSTLDEELARRAQAVGAKLLEGTTVTGPVLDDSGRIVGVETTSETEEKPKSRSRSDNAERSAGSSATYRARVVVAADGNSSRLSIAMGLRKRDDRPMGVAVRTYYTSPRHEDDYLESWLDLWDGDRLLPGYGWIFGMGDGTSNVGLGMLNTSDAFGKTDYRDLLKRWLKSMPEEWGYVEENRTEPVRGAALPMGFNRTPQYHQGLLLAGDAAGMVNPFNGEGIAYAMESGELLARVVAQALARPTRAETERVLRTYPEELQAAYGRYYTLGRVFVELIGRPKLMRYATSRGMHHPQLMRFALKLLANLTDPRDGDATDRVISAMTRL